MNIKNVAATIGAILVIQSFIAGIFLGYGKIRDRIKSYNENVTVTTGLDTRMKVAVVTINSRFNDIESDIEALKKENRDLKIKILGLEKVRREENRKPPEKPSKKYIFF